MPLRLGSEGPNTPHPPHHPQALGLRVILSPIDGVTPASLMKKPFLFQAPPLNDFTEEMAYNHGDYMTAFSGERSRPMGRQLETINLSTLWLDDGSRDHAPDWALVKKAKDPIVVKNQLKALLYAGSPMWLMIHQMPLWHRYDLKVMVTIRSFTSQEKEGENDARYFNFQFREWRTTDVRTKGQGATRNRVGPHGTNVTVKNLPPNRDTLYELAKYYYGSASQWKVIAKANGLTNITGTTNLKTRFAKTPSKKLHLPPPKKPAVSKPKARH
jgi:hypothetical protein